MKLRNVGTILFLLTALGVFVSGAQAQTEEGGSGATITSVSITNDLANIIINGEGFSDIRTVALIGTSCPTLMAPSSSRTDTAISLVNVSQYLGDCLVAYRGKQINLVLQGVNVSTNAYAVFVPDAPDAGVLESATPPPTENSPGPNPTSDGRGEGQNGEVRDGVVTSHCELNGKEVPCEDLADTVRAGIRIFGGIVIGFVILFIILFVFWVMMLVHLINHPVEYKVLWLICFLIFGALAALVYYLVVKRNFDTAPPASSNAPVQGPP